MDYCYYCRDNPFTKTKQNVDMLMDVVQDFSFSPKHTVGVSYNKQRYHVAGFCWLNFNLTVRKSAQQAIRIRKDEFRLGIVAFLDKPNH